MTTYRVCAEPDCVEITVEPRCKHCRSEREKNARPNSRARGYNHAWERTRAAHLQRSPTCTHPGCTAPATDVHHVDGRGPLGPRGHDPTNLKSYCHAHHSSITARGWGRTPKRSFEDGTARWAHGKVSEMGNRS